MKIQYAFLAAFGLCMGAAAIAEHNNGGYLFAAKASAEGPRAHSAAAGSKRLQASDSRSPHGHMAGKATKAEPQR